MNKKIVLIVIGIIVLVGVFYGGMTYGKSQTSASPIGGQTATFGGGARGTRGAGGFGGATIGQIISKDANSITVSLTSGGPASPSQGGSKIIFLDSNTPITKQASGTMVDLTVGTQVSITGTANTDGSITAQSVQIRPKMQVPAPAPSVVQ